MGAVETSMIVSRGRVTILFLSRVSQLRRATRDASDTCIYWVVPTVPSRHTGPGLSGVVKEHPHRSPHTGRGVCNLAGGLGLEVFERFGSSGRTRTYNPSVNSFLFVPSRHSGR